MYPSSARSSSMNKTGTCSSRPSPRMCVPLAVYLKGGPKTTPQRLL